MSLREWLRRVEWLWMIIGGFYLVAYLFWYIPALEELPDSVREPPAPYPWHWTLDFVATGVAGGVLLFLGFDRATEATPPGDEE
jgi:amino acid transporter